jgi:hypothetical protein
MVHYGRMSKVFSFLKSIYLDFHLNSSRDSNKNTSLIKKSSNGLNLDETSQIKLMPPILEGGENEDKLIDHSTRLNKDISLTRTIDWTPNEYI